jgi:hypothetical protein
MTLFEAPKYDPAAARKKWIRIIAIAAIVVVLGILLWQFRYWPEEHVVDQFFEALQQQNYEKAYGVWMHDPNWKQHPQQYDRYSFQNFMQDWGPGGEWGLIKSHHVDGSAIPTGGNGSPFIKGSSGVVVVVTVNERVADKAHIWVQKADKTLGFSPY